jgi:thiol-disulfide isomerase/thioredoxin
MKSTAYLRSLWAASFLLLAAACLSTMGQAQSQIQSIDGIWDATVTVNNIPIPFRIELSSNGAEVTSHFFNGDEKVNPSTQGSFRDGLLDLKFASYATELKATFNNGILTGSFQGGPGSSYPFEAKRHNASLTPAANSTAPVIDGRWEIQVKSPKGESAWHFIVKQSGSSVSAAILRVDGDTGTLSGSYRDGKFVLSHFTGERPFYVEVTPRADGTLQLAVSSFHDTQTLIALRPEAARAQGLAPPDDPTQHTKLKDPNEPLHFSFPDLQGQIVSDHDPRFRGKVVLVNITGSWCPNCHDEAPFLEALYEKYHDQGLEIVALDFEQSEQLKDPSRLRAFIQRYGIKYTYLVAGEPSQLNEKIPQAENLNTWPTTFFVGRDGLVHEIHTGFTSRASGSFDSDLKGQIDSDVARLISVNVQTASGSK